MEGVVKQAFVQITNQWFFQLAMGTLVIITGPYPWMSWLLLGIFMTVECSVIQRLTRESSPAAEAVWLIAKSPGIFLSGWVLLSFWGYADEIYQIVVLLQWWTSIFTSLILLTPKGGYHSYYLWFTAAIPFLQIIVGVASILWGRGKVSFLSKVSLVARQ